MATKPKNYSEKDIKSLHGLESVRKKPAMYIGPTDGHGLFTILRELGDNCVDEFLAGRNTDCHIIVTDKDFWCIDSGEGIPVGNIKFKSHGRVISMSALVAVFSQLHTGGKLDAGSAYDTSVGTHGVGAKATNALSNEFQVWTFRDKKWWHCGFKKGELTTKLVQKRPPKLPFNAKATKGTIIRYVPDMTCFDKGAKYRGLEISQWATLTSYLNAGFRVKLTNQGGKTTEYYSKNGSADYLKKKIEEYKCTPLGKPILCSNKQVDLALSFTDCDGVGLEGYTNGLLNVDGGTHVNALYAALTKAIAPYKKAKHKFTPVDLREGLVGIINAKIASPKFSSQTKDKLVDERVEEPVTEFLTKELTAFFKANKAFVTRLCDRANELKGLKDQFIDSKKVLKELSGAKKKNLLPSKFSGSSRDCPIHKREIFCVEGESAGGSARLARNQTFQEILPLKGKILNVYKAKEGRAFDSEEVMNILKVIGFDPSSKSPIDNLRVGKIILLSDADDDGFHINTLILSLLAKYLPKVFEKKMVHVVDAPEYVTVINSKMYYAATMEQLKKRVPNGKVGIVTHLKGWGEADVSMLREVAFNPSTRKHIRVNEIGKKEGKEFVALVSEDVAYRRKLLGV